MDVTDQATTIEADNSLGMRTLTLSRPGIQEFFFTANPSTGGVERMFQDVLQAVKMKQATIVSQDVFAPLSGARKGMDILSGADGAVDWPVTWVQSGHGNGSPLAGTLVHALSGAAVERVRADGRVIGSVYEDDEARYCRLGDLRAADTSVSRPDQALQTFEMIEAALGGAGMDFSHLVRTWLYLDELLSWYGPFNKVRTEYFGERGVFDRLVPASTGISGPNPYGAAVIAGALGIEPKAADYRAVPVPSPLQCPALEYGSSFSRAVEFGTKKCRRMSISGTASIEPGGETVHLDNVDGQIDLTMKVVDAILTSRRMGWDNVVRAIAYVKDNQSTAAVGQYLSSNDLTEVPVVITENHICRDNLLFELELEAIAVGSDIERG